MKNSYIESTTVSYGQNIKNSFSNVVLGLVLFFVSFIVLIWNEGNCVRSIQKEDFIIKNAIAVSSSSVDRKNDSKLIATNGSVYTDESLSDSFISVNKALKLKRNVEMYQWMEKTKTETQKNVGGSTIKTKTYSYEKGWDRKEHNSENFKKSEYTNPKFSYKSKEMIANSGLMGEFRINKNQISKISRYQNIGKLVPIEGFQIIDDDYYKGENYSSPVVGDIRISYSYVPSGVNLSIIGKQNSDNSISEMPTRSGPLYLQYDGIYSLDEMTDKYKQGNVLLTFGLRFVGFLVMLMGLNLLISPLIAISGFIPFLSRIVEFTSSFVLTAIALILSLLTIALAWIMYRPLVTVSLVILVIFIIYFIKNKYNK